MKKIKGLFALSVVGLLLVSCGGGSENPTSTNPGISQENPVSTTTSVEENTSTSEIDDSKIDSEAKLFNLTNKGETITKDYELTADIYYS